MPRRSAKRTLVRAVRCTRGKVTCLGRPQRRVNSICRQADRNSRPTFPAGVGLRVEASIGRVGVFAGATRAHLEGLHRSCRTVVGQRVDDGEARPAVRAVDERVAVAPVVGVEQLGQAIVAGGQVGRHQRGLLRRRVVGKADLEAGEILQRHFLEIDFRHLGRRRRVHVQLGHEPVKQLRLALGMDEHALGCIKHPTVDQVFFRQAVHERAETHPLHDALHLNVERLDHTNPLEKKGGHTARPSRTLSFRLSAARAPPESGKQPRPAHAR